MENRQITDLLLKILHETYPLIIFFHVFPLPVVEWIPLFPLPVCVYCRYLNMISYTNTVDHPDILFLNH